MEIACVYKKYNHGGRCEYLSGCDNYARIGIYNTFYKALKNTKKTFSTCQQYFINYVSLVLKNYLNSK